MRRRYNRYGFEETPSEEKLYAMYITEGVEPIEARKRARVLCKEMDNLSQREARSWKRVREHEFCSGLDPAHENYRSDEN